MSSKKTKIALTGAGGYGYYYLREMLDTPLKNNIDLVAVFDPNAEQLPISKELNDNNVSVFSDYNKFINRLTDCDLTVIVSPIHYHAQQAEDALKKGCNVLLDKPLAGNVRQAEGLLKTLESIDKWLMVGYQWSYSKAILKLKQDLLKGVFGKLNRAKTLVFWPRDYAYFNRNSWAGKIQLPDGTQVNDSLANNAMAHFIHNLLFLAGKDQWSCAQPVAGACELFRAYPIENYDTAVIKWTTRDQVEMLFYGSHVTRSARGPLFILECDQATIYYGELSNDIIAVFNDGTTRLYGSPDDTNQFEKLQFAVERCQDNQKVGVGAESAFQQTRLIDAVAQAGNIIDFPDHQIVETKAERRYVNGLGYMLLSSYHQGFMPSLSKFELKGTIQDFIL